MKFSVATLGLICLAGDATAFAPQSRTALPVQTSYFDASPLMAVSDGFEEDNQVPSAVSKMTNQAASVFAASVISASTLGLATVSTLPPPAFAAPAAKVETVAKKVAPEVAAVETAKQAAAAAAQALSTAQSKVPVASSAAQAANKEIKVAENNLNNAKKTAAAAKERFKSLSSNTKAFDQKTITTAEGRVSKYW